MKLKNSFMAAVASVMIFAGCASEASSNPEYSKSVEPEEMTELTVTDNSKFADAIPAGTYLFSVSKEEGKNPARFAIYVSDYQYETMNPDLEGDMVTTLGPNQEEEIALKNGNFVYIAAVSNETGAYEEGLSGSLEISSN